MANSVSGLISKVETYFDELKLGYKWKYNTWEHIKVVSYRGYGTRTHVYLKGRVLDDKGAIISDTPQNVWQNFVNTWRRIETDEVPGARVMINVGSRRLEVETDEDGYFDVNAELHAPLPENETWHRIRLELVRPKSDRPVIEEGHVLVPAEDAEFAVVSDLDDTVIKTGATSSLRMLRTTLLNNARTRIPLPGVGALYRAMEKGPDQRGHNPTFYVSSSPWNLYDLFDAFMRAHDIPAGPLFLKDFGFSEDKFFKSGHEGHKISGVERLLELYPDLPFVLIGDSGQQDPEIYREIVRNHSGRIRAVYVRDVTPPERDREVRSIAEDVGKFGVPMVLVEDSVEAAEHAAEIGLIHRDAIADVRAVKEEDEQRAEPQLLEQLLGPSGDGKSVG